MALTASIPFPENPEHRAEATRRVEAATGLNRDVLEALVRAFYDRARRDALIGMKFDGVHNWEDHIARITTFWSSVALQTGEYHGQPLPRHVPLGLQGEHFRRWLALFEETAREVCSPAGAALVIEKARRIAQSMEIGMAVARGELPPLRRPPQR